MEKGVAKYGRGETRNELYGVEMDLEISVCMVSIHRNRYKIYIDVSVYIWNIYSQLSAL